MALTISDKALLMMIGFEVTDAQVYAEDDLHPTWPGGASGVTLGIGYDCGYQTAATIAKDWAALGDATIARLSNVAGLTGVYAQQAIPHIADIVIPFDLAETVFTETDIPRTIALVDATFSNCDNLSPDSLGALVSLVYNRGANCADIPTRLEMYEIQQDMLIGNFAAVPGHITAMKRLWYGVPGMEGLLARRDAEAALFQSGLGTVAAVVPSPTVLAIGSTGADVSALQTALKAAGYYKAYAVDGVYGTHTCDAVVNYQIAHKLYGDGIAGQQTLASLKLT